MQLWYVRGGNDILISKSKNIINAENNTSSYTVQKSNRLVMTANSAMSSAVHPG